MYLRPYEKKEGEVGAFLYIPDMTGFTEFMTTTNPRESHRVVEETLKVIAGANMLDLHISDIAGDAVFFYRTGLPPTLDEVIEQSRVISERFSDRVKAYGSKFNWDTNRVEQMHHLSIKFIAHYGKVAVSDIENHTKLIGVPAIEAHRLLKNSVEIDNYLLATEAYLQVSATTASDYPFTDGKDSYEHIGEVKYKVLNLSKLPVTSP